MATLLIEELHTDVQASFNTSESLPQSKKDEIDAEVAKLVSSQKPVKNLEEFWEEHNMVVIMDAAEFIRDNYNDPAIYSVLSQEYDLTEAELTKVFQVVELNNIINFTVIGKSGCGWATAGMIVAIGGSFFLTGGASLLYWGGGG